MHVYVRLGVLNKILKLNMSDAGPKSQHDQIEYWWNSLASLQQRPWRTHFREEKTETRDSTLRPCENCAFFCFLPSILKHNKLRQCTAHDPLYPCHPTDRSWPERRMITGPSKTMTRCTLNNLTGLCLTTTWTWDVSGCIHNAYELAGRKYGGCNWVNLMEDGISIQSNTYLTSIT